MAKKKTSAKNKEEMKEESQDKVEKPSDEHEKQNRMKSFYIRTISTIAMLGGFALILFLGHAYCALFVISLLILGFKELKALKRKKEMDKNIPWFNVVNWYFLVWTITFILPLYFPNQTIFSIQNPLLLTFLEYHKLISFSMFIAGILLFTLSLEHGSYKYQFKMLGWTILVLLFVCIQTWSLIYNIYKGIYWFIFPWLCVVWNDIFAYIFGFFFGKTPLIKLSPKKTWEGFVGGAVITFIWAFIASMYLSSIPALACPQTNITFEPFAFPHCKPIALYLPTKRVLPFAILGIEHVWIAQVQLHSLVIAVFSSLIAPFGGFFASGFKRAFRIKDFGTTIPGHGGITDRFDCQLMMWMFTFVYLHEIVFRINPTVDGVMNTISKLTASEQMGVYNILRENLFNA
jgi:phosphatidate cytidylyltransferase